MTTTTTRARIAGTVSAAIVLALLITLGPRPVAVPDEPTGDAELAAFLKDRAPRGAGRITAFVIQDDQVRYAGLGADEHLEHEIGSISKTMVGELLHDATEGGSLALTTTVGDLVPASGAPVADVTLRELATHTSGLPRLGPTGIMGWVRAVVGSDPYTGITPDDVIAHSLDAELTDRGQDEYSNLGYALLGHLLAQSAQVPFPTLMQEKVLTPLGMQASYVAADGTVAADAPRGRAVTGRLAEPWDSEGYGPAGSVRSTSHDMALYARHVLSSQREPLSWADTTVGEHQVMWHNGGTGGYSTMLVLHRPTGTAAYVATDSTASVDDLGLDLFAHLHGIAPKGA